MLRSIDGSKASASQDRPIRLWEVSPTGLAFSLDGNLLLSGSADETMRLWDIQRGVCLETVHIPGPYAGMKIAGASGLTPAQIANLKALGAVS